MNKNVSYNFVVVDGSSVGPSSSLDPLSGVMEFEDLANSFSPSPGPCVAVKVIDREAKGASIVTHGSLSLTVIQRYTLGI